MHDIRVDITCLGIKAFNITGFDAEACWPLNEPLLLSPLNPLYSLMGEGVTGPPLSTNWSGRVLAGHFQPHAIISQMQCTMS